MYADVCSNAKDSVPLYSYAVLFVIVNGSSNKDEPLGLVASIVLDDASRISLSVLTCPVSYNILSLLFPMALLFDCNRSWNTWSNNVSRVEARIG